MHKALAKSGIDTAPERTFEDYVSSQGFINVQSRIMKWSCPPWPEDEAEKTLGRMHRHDFLRGVEGLSMMLLTKQLGRTKEEVDDLIQVRQDLEDLGKNIYCPV